ncbi:MAG: biotin/lipoyl-containing protein [Candidatus Heimdallarchaeota archaeon]
MKKKYRIIIEGKAYEVEVEELEAVTASPVPSSVNSRPTARSPAKTEPIVPTPPTTSVSRPSPRGVSVRPELKTAPPPTEPVPGKGAVTAPIPGTVLRVDFKVGDSVSQGDVLLILEAMKMENEIIAPQDGKIKKIVSPNTTVNFGDELCIIE